MTIGGYDAEHVIRIIRGIVEEHHDSRALNDLLRRTCARNPWQLTMGTRVQFGLKAIESFDLRHQLRLVRRFVRIRSSLRNRVVNPSVHRQVVIRIFGFWSARRWLQIDSCIPYLLDVQIRSAVYPPEPSQIRVTVGSDRCRWRWRRI